jgi:hypothetical protein
MKRLCNILLGSIYLIVTELICMLFVFAVCAVTNSSLVLGPLGCSSMCRGWMPAYLKENW